jgi:anaerobic nitric oxide reductase flavorubredoxin
MRAACRKSCGTRPRRPSWFPARARRACRAISTRTGTCGPVKTGDRLSLGRKELLFIEAPLLHWPDSMFTYVAPERVLFPNDAFGQHYATAFRFNDQVDAYVLYDEALKYYANILTPYSHLVTKKLDEFAGLGLPVDIIAPSHGVIWRQDPLQIVNQYKAWAAQTPERRAVIVYDTMWNATRRMAEAIGEGLTDEGVEHKLCHAVTGDRNDTLKEAFRARTILMGSSTLNNGLLPSLWPLLHDLKGLRFKNKLAGAFGSFGWSGENVPLIEAHFKACGFPLVAPGVKCKWQPDAEGLRLCREFGRAAGRATLAP